MTSSAVSSRASLIILTLLVAVTVTWSAVAQVPAPTVDPTPVASPAPAGTPAPPVITPGLPNQGDLEAYRDARTPQANLLLGQAVASTPSLSATSPFARSAASANAPLPTTATGGSFPQIVLAPTTSSLAAAPAKHRLNAAPATATTGSTPPQVTVTLSYAASWAGNLVRVQILGGHGGMLSATGGDGQTVQVNDSFFLTLDAAGQAAFAFQAPATPNTYQVLTRLENVETVFNFLVPDPEP